MNPLFMITCYALKLWVVNQSPAKKNPAKGMKFSIFGVKLLIHLSL
ncbi:hypothetical protein X474_08355 [Dethiosulfatarculus sandiegensis]|uniref:Uncharacterized protein n=1 Tax=Dethiosulfatarculus sandiegensis TaxID=1429043 RepID=A0A0D2GIM0_9BACT|nr:hypothetical protein X474_08355 [Dethiosulfatarculus sandiegensis]